MAHNDTHAARKKGGAGKILLVVLLLLLLAVGAAVHFAYNEIHGNGAPGSTEVTVSIPQGSGVAAIANKLKEAGVIRSAYLFRWYVGQKGAAAKLQYGDFVLQTSAISYDAIIATLSQYAKAETVRVTIPEGTTAIAIAQKMESAGLCTAEEFLKEANEGDFSAYTFWQYVPEDKEAPNRFMKCEGYLFPETYEFLKDDTVHNYVATFYAQFDAQFTKEMYAALKKQGMTLPELVTLAPLCRRKRATVRTPTWRRCSAIVWQRLALPPAAKQHLQPYPERRRQQLSLELGRALLRRLGQYPGKYPYTYDTYSCIGLPAGPISNPGLAAIKQRWSRSPMRKPRTLTSL